MMKLSIENAGKGQGDILSLLKLMSNELGIDTNLTIHCGKGDLEDRSPKITPRPMTRDQASQTVPRGKLKQHITYDIFSL